MWSLGATMFTLVSGRTVHPGESGPQFLVQSATRDAPKLRDVCPDAPEPIANVIDRALARRAEDRFSSAEEMREAFIVASRAAWSNVAGAHDLALLFAPTRNLDRESAEAITQVAQEPTPVTPHAPPGADTFFRAIVHTARDLGVDEGAALEATGITPSKLAETPATAQYLVEFLENAARIGNQPSLGVKMAFGLPLGASGALDYATRTSSTLRDAIERTSRLLSYVTDRVRLLLEEEGDHVRVVFRTNEGAPSGPQIAEFLIAVVLHRARDALRSSVPITAIHFKHAKVEGGMDLEEMFGAPVKYEQERDEFVMSRSLLFLRFETSDPMLADLLERHTSRMTKRP
jgi:hypothetical protein